MSFNYTKEVLNAKCGYLIDDIIKIGDFKELCEKIATEIDGITYGKIMRLLDH
jgi:hypothetical protein